MKKILRSKRDKLSQVTIDFQKSNVTPQLIKFDGNEDKSKLNLVIELNCSQNIWIDFIFDYDSIFVSENLLEEINIFDLGVSDVLEVSKVSRFNNKKNFKELKKYFWLVIDKTSISFDEVQSRVIHFGTDYKLYKDSPVGLGTYMQKGSFTGINDNLPSIFIPKNMHSIPFVCSDLFDLLQEKGLTFDISNIGDFSIKNCTNSNPFYSDIPEDTWFYYDESQKFLHEKYPEVPKEKSFPWFPLTALRRKDLYNASIKKQLFEEEYQKVLNGSYQIDIN